QQANHDREQDALSPELHPGEGVRGEGGQGDRHHGGRDGDDQAVDEGVEHPVGAQHVGVVRQGPGRFEGVEKRGPPSGRVDVPSTAKRADQEAGGGKRPEHGDEDHRRPDPGTRPPGRSHCLRGTSIRPGSLGRILDRRLPASDDGIHDEIPCRRRLRTLTTMIGITATRRMTANAEARPGFRNRISSENIRLATTSVSKRPPVVTNTMSNTLRITMKIVVATVMMEPRIVGTTPRRKICSSEAPSIRAASTSSSGTPLMAAERITIAKPVWSQIMIRISTSVLRGGLWKKAIGSLPIPSRTALARPIWGCPGGRQ